MLPKIFQIKSSRGINFINWLELKILETQDPEYAMLLAIFFGRILTTENTGRYTATEIERHIIKLFKFNLIARKPLKQDETLHVITTPYATGGHTRLMESLAAHEKKQPYLMVTEEYTTQSLLRAQTIFKKIIFVPKGTFRDRISWMASHLIQFKNIVLHIHQYDLASLVACEIAKSTGSKIFFVNHGDNLFTFGATIADVWFQLGTNGVTIDSKRELAGQTSFLGIASGTLEEFQHPPKNTNPSPTIIATAGAGYKYKPLNRDFSFFKLISTLLEKYPNSKFHAIGVNGLTDYWWIPIKLRYWSRIKLHSSMPFEQYIKFMENIDLYIDSYPYHGGTAFSQQFAKGKNCRGLITGYEGYSPIEQLKSTTVNQLIESLDKPTSSAHLKLLLEKTLTVNSAESVVKRYQDALDGKLTKFDREEFYLLQTTPPPRPRFKTLSARYPILLILEIIKYDPKISIRLLYASSAFATIIYSLKSVKLFLKRKLHLT